MTVLDDIIAGVRLDMAARRELVDDDAVRAAAAAARTPLDPMPHFRSPGMSVISEVKRRSPSKGELADIPDPTALATAYSRGGAGAISVLTEERRFGGSLDDLRAVRAAVETPLLRKDFVVDAYQIHEARAAGADMILLIVAALDDSQLQALHEEALTLGLTPLVEVHDEEETRRAVDLGAELIGVNARNLKTLAVDNDTFGRLAPLIPDDRVKVAESGIFSPADVQRFADEGARVVLVGEALVKDGDPEAAVRAMSGITPTNATGERS